ncbi:MAG: tRNA pseudouridine(55) synthase TruB [Myxococcota bacterium]|nr:tRNA pseudouridine(55) synthase TruB [Myxococcota bacterium]
MGRRRKGRSDQILQGVLLVDKPVGLSSHEVCQRVKGRLRLGKVGHGGTLDPFATGLLPLLLNGATRLMPQLQGVDKVYEAVVRLGSRTDTMDPTGEVIAEGDPSGVAEEDVRAVLPRFLGEIEQTVPRYSAARVDGRRLYDYARAGEEVELPVKQVTIESIELLSFDRSDEGVDVSLRVACSAGTYVRALADEIGESLGCHAHLYTLRRTRTGSLSVDSGIELETIVEQSAAWREERQLAQEDGSVIPFVARDNAQRWSEFFGDSLVSVSRLLGGLPTLRLPDALARRVQSGQPLRKSELGQLDASQIGGFRSGDRLVLEDAEGLRGVAIVRATCSNESLARREASAVILEVERVLA